MKAMLSFLAGAVAFVGAQTGLLAILPPAAQTAIGAVGAVLGVLGIRGAAGSPQTVKDLLDKLGGGWKTAAGVLLALFGAFTDPAVAALLPASWAHGIQLAGTVLAALGLYHAQAKAA